VIKSFRDRKLFIASPAGDGKFCAEYLLSLSESIKLFNQYGLRYTFNVLQKCSILPHARNRLADAFLRSDCTHMLFADADMGWDPRSPLELLAHDKDVIALVGVTKDEQKNFCCWLDKETLKYDDKTGLIRVHHVGTGFMLISRNCIRKLTEAWKHRAYMKEKGSEDTISPIFEIEYREGTMFGEDYTFCNRWRALGGEIWVDPSLPLEHVGQYVYTGTYADALKAVDERRTEAA
jgi:hypothetical protein